MSMLLFVGFAPSAAGVEKLMPGVHYFCSDINTQDLYYGGSGAIPTCNTDKKNFGNSHSVIVTSTTLSKLNSKDKYFCIDFQTSDLYRLTPNNISVTCKVNYNVILVATNQNEPVKYSKTYDYSAGHYFVCIAPKTGNLTFGGAEKKPLCKVEGSEILSIAAAKGFIPYPVAGSFENKIDYLLCTDIKTKVVTHPLGNKETCGKNSVSFIIGAKGQNGATGLTGATGLNGADGRDGKTLWNGTKDPEITWGAPGDMYINATAKTLFGPKNLDGTWPAGVSLVGPKGDQGPIGLTGATGPQGPGGSGPAGPAGPAGTNGTNATLTCAQGGTCEIGNTGPGGGIVFYVSNTPNTAETPWRYMEAAPNTWSGGVADPTMKWCSNTTNFAASLITGSTASKITSEGVGKGFYNTKVMLGSCTYGAANMAASYNGGGKSDWFLPSYYEMYFLKEQKTAVGGFNSGIYWTSSELYADIAWFHIMVGGSASSEGKIDTFYVRPVRAF